MGLDDDPDAAAADLERIEREYASVIALLDRAAAFRYAAALVHSQVGLDVGLAAERVDNVDTMTVCAVAGTAPDSSLLDLTIPAGMGLAGRVAIMRHPVAVVDYLYEPTITHDFDPYWRAEGLRGAIAVPVIRGHQFYGVLIGANRAPCRFGDREVGAMVHLARQAGLAIEVADHATEMVDVAVHEERRQLALTLHDSVGAMLFSIGAATRDLGSEQACPPLMRERLAFVEKQVAKASAELRQALRALSDVPQDVALGVALRGECKALEQRSGIKARCVVLDDLPDIDEGRAEVLLLAAREALLNVEKHAGARSVVVSVHVLDEGVSLVIADDGVGLPAQRAGAQGLGVDATAERLARVGGRLTLAPNEDGGCTMRAWVPC
jgi:signal transduction histidine kinase